MHLIEINNPTIKSHQYEPFYSYHRDSKCHKFSHFLTSKMCKDHIPRNMTIINGLNWHRAHTENVRKQRYSMWYLEWNRAGHWTERRLGHLRDWSVLKCSWCLCCEFVVDGESLSLKRILISNGTNTPIMICCSRSKVMNVQNTKSQRHCLERCEVTTLWFGTWMNKQWTGNTIPSRYNPERESMIPCYHFWT